MEPPQERRRKLDQLETLAIGGIRLAINGFLLWVLWYCLWRPQFVADTRQRLFEIRDGLFLRAQKEAKGFDFEAYRLLEAPSIEQSAMRIE